MVLLQIDPLPDLRILFDGFRITISAPYFHEQRSIRGGWINPTSITNYRFGDFVRIEVRDVAVADATRSGFINVEEQVSVVVQRLLRRLLQLLQVESGQPWLGRLPSPVPWYLFPLEYVFYDEGGNVLQASDTTAPIIERDRYLTAERWQVIGHRLGSGEELPLPQLLLTDAFAFRLAGDVRSAVLALAMTCEVAIKIFVREVGGKKDPVYTYLVDRDRELSIFDYFDKIIAAVTGKELQVVLEGQMAQTGRKIGITDMKRLFEARNKVAHEGRPYYRTGKGHEREVDDEALDIWEALTQRLLSWLDAQRAAAMADVPAASNTEAS